MKNVGNLDIRKHEQELQEQHEKVMDYEELYVEIMYYLKDNIVDSMSEAAIHAEQITEIVEQKVEEVLTDGQE